jgi:hypothetical protein
LKDLVLGQAKINENFIKKLMFNDKMLENINSKLESLSSSVKSQLSFNNMIETQIAQIACWRSLSIKYDCQLSDKKGRN